MHELENWQETVRPTGGGGAGSTGPTRRGRDVLGELLHDRAYTSRVRPSVCGGIFLLPAPTEAKPDTL